MLFPRRHANSVPRAVPKGQLRPGRKVQASGTSKFLCPFEQEKGPALRLVGCPVDKSSDGSLDCACHETAHIESKERSLQSKCAERKTRFCYQPAGDSSERGPRKLCGLHHGRHKGRVDRAARYPEHGYPFGQFLCAEFRQHGNGKLYHAKPQRHKYGNGHGKHFADDCHGGRLYCRRGQCFDFSAGGPKRRRAGSICSDVRRRCRGKSDGNERCIKLTSGDRAERNGNSGWGFSQPDEC